MISDEPDEDADNLDDENLLETYLRPAAPSQQAEATSEPKLTDWPTWRDHHATRSIDGSVTAWFKANHDDWRETIEFVLRAWVVARSRAPGSAPPPA